jgi:hypothetical protein
MKKNRPEPQKRNLCPLGRSVDNYRIARGARQNHEPVLGTPCMRGACGWWSSEYGCCGVLATVKALAAVEVMEAKQGACDTSEGDPLTVVEAVQRATTEAPQKPHGAESELKPLHQHVKGWLRSLRSP